MTDTTGPSPDTPHELLASARDLRRRVRAVQRGTWFPLLLLGALTLGAIPADRYGHYGHACQTIHPSDGPPGRVCIIYDAWSLIYWTVALILAYAVTALFYVRRSRARGVGTPIGPYIAAGIGIAAAVTAFALWRLHDPLGLQRGTLGLNLGPQSGMGPVLYQLTGPAGAIGLALLVLSWVERHPALTVVTAVYLAVVLMPASSFSSVTRPSPWFFLPRLLIEGTLLLLAGLGFALTQPRHPHTAS